MFCKEVVNRAVVHYLHFTPSLRKVGAIYGASAASLSRWVRKHLGVQNTNVRSSPQGTIKRLLVKPKIEQEVNGKRVVREVRGIRLCPESHLEPRTTPIVYDREPERWRGYRRLLRDVVGALNMLVVAGKKNEDRPGLLKRTTRYYEATVVT